jgi:hypothetical protein
MKTFAVLLLTLVAGCANQDKAYRNGYVYGCADALSDIVKAVGQQPDLEAIKSHCQDKMYKVHIYN